MESIYHPLDIKIKDVKLSASSDSIFSFDPNFKLQYPITAISNHRIDEYRLQPSAHHNYQVRNFTAPYALEIRYFNKTNLLNDLHFQFSWPARTMDLNEFSYFRTVLIGVMVSRLLSLMLNKMEEARTEATAAGVAFEDVLAMTPISLNINDAIWIAFSFIIALLIFSCFSGQVHLTINIVTNVSLASGFGFGFDKVLEVTKRFQDIS